MKPRERERSHGARLDMINQVQVVSGAGDAARTDHEATLLERARLFSEEIHSHAATERGLAAFDRLLRRVEQAEAGPAREVALFLDAFWNGRPLPLLLLRGQDPAVGDDMLAVLDAYRYARLNLVEHVEGGPRRVSRVLARCLRCEPG